MITKEIAKRVAKEYGRSGIAAGALARSINVTTSHLQYIVTRMRKEGVNIPRIRNTSVYIEATSELRKENPELFD